MRTCIRGTFVISWSQTDVDGVAGATVSALTPGTVWRWHGEPLRVDGPGAVLRLERTDEQIALHRRAAPMVRRLVGRALAGDAALPDPTLDDAPFADSGFDVTDGRQAYRVTLIDLGPRLQPLLMFVDQIPPADRDLWIVRCRLDRTRSPGLMRAQRAPDAPGAGVICFAPGTRIRTPQGPRLVETLRPGELVVTKDSGPSPIRWIGKRHMTGARLMAMPELRPIRIRAGAFGLNRPEGELIVSPGHRMLVRGAVAQRLFNTDEVLVAARDLVDGRSVRRDLEMAEVTYIHLMLDSHQILFANGTEAESFHPGSADLSLLGTEDRARLQEVFPQVLRDPGAYGHYARRLLSHPEAAIMRHKAA